MLNGRSPPGRRWCNRFGDRFNRRTPAGRLMRSKRRPSPISLRAVFLRGEPISLPTTSWAPPLLSGILAKP